MVKYITRHGPIPGPGPGPAPCSPGLNDLHVPMLPNGVVSGSRRRREEEEGTAASSSSSSRCCWRPAGASAPGSGRPAGLDSGLPRRVWTEPGRRAVIRKYLSFSIEFSIILLYILEELGTFQQYEGILHKIKNRRRKKRRRKWKKE